MEEEGEEEKVMPSHGAPTPPHEGGERGLLRYSGRWCMIQPAGASMATANTNMMKKLCPGPILLLGGLL